MNNEILTINDYPIGWGWLQKVPLKDWEWLIDIFATMTDNTDTYLYVTYAEEDGAKQEIVKQVNDIYSDGTESYTTIEEVLGSFTFKVGASQGKAYLESQEISFDMNGTVIKEL